MTSCTRAYKFRLYSSNEQRVLIHKTFGCYRFIYNYFLDKCKTNCYMKAYDICIFLKGLYYEFPFLKEEDSCSLRCAIFNLEDSYKRFFFKKLDILNLKINILNKLIEQIVYVVLIKKEHIVIFSLI